MKRLHDKQPFPLEGWNREEHFHFFRTFTQPFFNISTEVDISELYHYCKRNALSVFLGYMHAATEAARGTESFLLRMEGDTVVKYDAVDISTTILKHDKAIAFVHLPHHQDLHVFCAESAEIIARAKESKGLLYGYNGPDLIHSTTLPWFKLKAMEHAFTVNPDDSVPKFGFGQLEFAKDRVILPVNISLHHALADGYHIHLYLEKFKELVQRLAE